MDKPGYYFDNHYTAYFPELLDMAKTGRIFELEMLLLPLIEAMEAECAAEELPRPRLLHDVLLTALRLRRAPRREQMMLLEDYVRYPQLLEEDRAWAENELEQVRGQLTA